MKPSWVGLALLLISFLYCANAFNITKILGTHPEYRKFNHYLSLTRLADDINSRKTITVLVVRNGPMHSMKGLDLETIKRSLSLHVLLDYFDAKRLHRINNHTTLTTTLFQTTGLALGNAGFINITDIKGKKVAFGPAAKGSKLNATYVKGVMKEGFNLSVLEVSQPITTIVAAAAAPVESPNEVNMSAVLVNGGCEIFAGMISATGVVKSYANAVYSGLTVFAPTDAAFTRVKNDLKKLSSKDKESLLEFHALPIYSPRTTLKFSKRPIATMASTGPGKYDIKVSSAGDTVILNTGVDKATITSTLLDDVPMVILTVDKVLKPKELFALAPAPVPAPSPPVPAPEAESPGATPSSSSPTPAGAGASNDSSASFAPASSGVCHGLLLFLIGCVGVLML